MRLLTFLFLAVVGLSSCSTKLTPFTDRLNNDFNWSEGELKNIQFYLSKDIVLYRDLGNSQTQLTEGKIKIVDGRRIEEVVFKEGTPGVFVFSPKKDQFAISFDETDDKYLMFGASKKVSGRFVLLAKDWNRRNGKISYDDKVWRTSNESALASLLVDLEKASTTEVRKKTASGRKVGG